MGQMREGISSRQRFYKRKTAFFGIVGLNRTDVGNPEPEGKASIRHSGRPVTDSSMMLASSGHFGTPRFSPIHSPVNMHLKHPIRASADKAPLYGISPHVVLAQRTKSRRA